MLPIQTSSGLRVNPTVLFLSAILLSSSVAEEVPATERLESFEWDPADPDAPPETNALSRFLEDLDTDARLTLDLSSRAIYETGPNGWAFGQFFGIDYLKTFTSPRGDWGTLIAQVFLTRIDNLERRPQFFESDDDWELVTRITNFNFTGLAAGKFNIRVGHVEIPFGLEIGINSNGTIRQVLTEENLGIVTDWGFGFNGTFPKFKYEFTLSRGTGNEYSSNDDPFVFAGRVGTPDDQESFSGSPGAGLSVFYGDVLGEGGVITTRRRVGLDATTYLGPLTLLGEISAGDDDGDQVFNTLAEVNWVTPREDLVIYTQARTFNQRSDSGWDNDVSAVLGFRFTPNNFWALSAQYEQQLAAADDNMLEGFLTLQARFRF